MKIFYAIIIFLCLFAFVMGIWGGGILVFFLSGCCFAGFIMLCHIAVLLYRKLKEFLSMVSDWIKSLGEWLSTHKKAIGIGSIILAILGIISILYCFTDIFSIILQKQYETKDYAGVVVSVAIGTIVSILAIASPILINAINNLSKRYKNNAIVTLFLKRKELKYFKCSLYVSLVLSACWLCCHYIYDNSTICYNLTVFLLYIMIACLVICLLFLIREIVAFMTPSKLVKIIKEDIENLEMPPYYFDKNVYKPLQYGSKEEEERYEKFCIVNEYDIQSMHLYTLIAKIWELYYGDIDVHKNILDFWREKCRIASSVTKEKRKYYTNCYYNFIYEAFDYAIEHNDPATQTGVVSFLNILLNSHLGEPRKYREPESEIHKIKYGLSWETIECMWIAMQKSVNCPNEGMFREYWQIAYNFYSRKYLNPIDISVDCPIIDKIDNEQSFYYAIHYLCCSYLMGRKKYNLLDFALNYSQCMPFKWYLMPDNALDVVKTYTVIKDWHSDINNQERFSLKNSRNLYDEVIASRPIEQFTCLLLLLLWQDDNDKYQIALNSKWNTDRYLESLKQVVNNITAETDWIKYFHMEEFLTKKESIVKWLENLTSKTQ